MCPYQSIIEKAPDGYQEPCVIQQLLKAAAIPVTDGELVHSGKELLSVAERLGFPLVLKVVGPVHKSDIDGLP